MYNYHSLPSIHNKPAAERETKYSQTFVQQSPFRNGIKVTVIYTAGDRYIQVNFAENKIKATGNFGKLSGDRNIKGDCYYIYRSTLQKIKSRQLEILGSCPVTLIYRVTAIYRSTLQEL